MPNKRRTERYALPLKYPLVIIAALISSLASCPGLKAPIVDVSPRFSNATASDGYFPSGKAISLGISKDGGRIYAGTTQGGLWRSDNGGTTFHQLVSEQPGDAAPTCALGGPTNCRLASSTIVAIAVSPEDSNLVFVGTANDRARPERDGIYRSADGGETWQLVFQQACPTGGILGVTNQPVGQISFAPDNSTKLWAAVGCAVAYSTVGADSPASDAEPAGDVGILWTPKAPISITPVNAFHVTVGQHDLSGRRAVWACAPAELWYSPDGGETYTTAPADIATQIKCDVPTGSHGSSATEASVIAASPHDPFHAFFIGLGSETGLGYEINCCQADCASHRPVCEPEAEEGTKTFEANALGPGNPTRYTLLEISTNGGGKFASKTHYSPPIVRPVPAGSGGVSLLGVLNSNNQLLLFMSDDSTVHVAEAPPDRPDAWHRLDGLDVSKACTLLPPEEGVADSFRARCKDGSLAPQDASDPPHSIHVDPHVIAVTPGIELRLKPPGPESFRVQSGLRTCGPNDAIKASSGRIVMGNDGGITVSTDCGVHWASSDRFNTFSAGTLAGISVPGKDPYLYIGGADDGSWWSSDGGRTWQIGDSRCGDCEGFFADPESNAITHRRRHSSPDFYQVFSVWQTIETPPDPAAAIDYDVEWQRPYVDWHTGWEPLIAAAPGEDPIRGVDFVIVAGEEIPPAVDGVHPPDPEPDSPRFVWRKRGNVPWERIGVPLPPAAGVLPVVQAAGGHQHPVFFVSDRTGLREPFFGDMGDVGTQRAGVGRHLWRSRLNGDGDVEGWDCIVPGPAAPDTADGSCAASPENEDGCPVGALCRPWSFSVNPFNAAILYIVDTNGVKESTDGGNHFALVKSLDRWLGSSGRISPPCRWTCGFDRIDKELGGFLFVRDEPGTRFAYGVNGVFVTVEGAEGAGEIHGESWHRLLDPASLACQPTRVFFDTNAIRSLFVGCSQRGVLRILQIPDPGDEIDFSPFADAGTEPIELRPGESTRARQPVFDPSAHMIEGLESD